MAKAKKAPRIDFMNEAPPPGGPSAQAVTTAAGHPQGVLLVLKNRARALLAEWDAAWTFPAPVISDLDATVAFGTGSLPAGTAIEVDWGDGATQTFTVSGASTGGTHTYDEAGDYTITAVAGPTFSQEGRSTKTQDVTVTEPPPP